MNPKLSNLFSMVYSNTNALCAESNFTMTGFQNAVKVIYCREQDSCRTCPLFKTNHTRSLLINVRYNEH